MSESSSYVTFYVPSLWFLFLRVYCVGAGRRILRHRQNSEQCTLASVVRAYTIWTLNLIDTHRDSDVCHPQKPIVQVTAGLRIEPIRRSSRYDCVVESLCRTDVAHDAFCRWTECPELPVGYTGKIKLVSFFMRCRWDTGCDSSLSHWKS